MGSMFLGQANCVFSFLFFSYFPSHGLLQGPKGPQSKFGCRQTLLQHQDCALDFERTLHSYTDGATLQVYNHHHLHPVPLQKCVALIWSYVLVLLIVCVCVPHALLNCSGKTVHYMCIEYHMYVSWKHYSFVFVTVFFVDEHMINIHYYDVLTGLKAPTNSLTPLGQCTALT